MFKKKIKFYFLIKFLLNLTKVKKISIGARTQHNSTNTIESRPGEIPKPPG